MDWEGGLVHLCCCVCHVTGGVRYGDSLFSIVIFGMMLLSLVLFTFIMVLVLLVLLPVLALVFSNTFVLNRGHGDVMLMWDMWVMMWREYLVEGVCVHMLFMMVVVVGGHNTCGADIVPCFLSAICRACG